MLENNGVPAFEVRSRDNPDGPRFRVFADGRMDGFPPDYTLVVNRIPTLIGQATTAAALSKSTPRELALLEAVRVRPNGTALKEAREMVGGLVMVRDRKDKGEVMAVGALQLILELYDKVAAVIATHGGEP